MNEIDLANLMVSPTLRLLKFTKVTGDLASVDLPDGELKTQIVDEVQIHLDKIMNVYSTNVDLLKQFITSGQIEVKVLERIKDTNVELLTESYRLLNLYIVG